MHEVRKRVVGFMAFSWLVSSSICMEAECGQHGRGGMNHIKLNYFGWTVSVPEILKCLNICM